MKINQEKDEIIFLERKSDAARETEHFLNDVEEGLSATEAYIPSHYFYDDRGSELFQEITNLDEYYLTGAERNALFRSAPDLARLMGQKTIDHPLNVVELGCGDGHKTFVLLQEFVEKGIPVRFVPIDISQGAVQTLLDALDNSLRENIEIVPIVSDYFQAIEYVEKNMDGISLFLFLGSSIGNFTRERAIQFLRHIYESLVRDDHLLIGFDLIKDEPTMKAAYNDSAGVTREFNMNLLDRMNRELDADFHRENFYHLPEFNEELSAMQSSLVSRKDHTVTIGRLQRSFPMKEGQKIHLEYSHKYTLQSIAEMAADSGFELIKNFTDDRGLFVDSLWRAG